MHFTINICIHMYIISLQYRLVGDSDENQDVLDGADWFKFDSVRNPEDRFSREEAQSFY